MNQEKLINARCKLKQNTNNIEISKSLLNRYKNLPAEYLTFLEEYEEIINETDTGWFNLNKEFNGNAENEFKWNEFELMSLEWSEDNNDELRIIAKFWETHIPIIMSVKDVYQFFAICLNNEKYGKIVKGSEPVFEETQKVCDNFEELINLIGNGIIII